VAMYRLCIALGGDNDWANFGIAMSLLKLGDSLAARRALQVLAEKAASAAWRAFAEIQLGNIAERSRTIGEARGHYTTALAIADEESEANERIRSAAADAFCGLGHIQYIEGNLAEAAAM